MPDDEIVWPVGTSDRDPDLASRPLIFDPRGFLVALLPDGDAADQAAAALRAAGFGGEELRIFTSRQILDDHARYTDQKSLRRRVVSALTDDQESIALYQAHARDGCFALWVHVRDDVEADRAIRGLAGCATRHIRHYGHRRQSDFVLQSPTP
ncbi:MAG: hypothetical protein JWR45_2388 [Blastococcus sp.]|jgi:hypothetical protein|nr:hypothetical protein [Blastococcus sp.]